MFARRHRLRWHAGQQRRRHQGLVINTLPGMFVSQPNVSEVSTATIPQTAANVELPNAAEGSARPGLCWECD